MLANSAFLIVVIATTQRQIQSEECIKLCENTNICVQLVHFLLAGGVIFANVSGVGPVLTKSVFQPSRIVALVLFLPFI